MDVPLDSVEIELRAAFDSQRKYGLGDVSPACQELVYTLDISSPAPEARIREAVQQAEAMCYAVQTFKEPVPVVPVVRLNGREVPFDL
jgi:hypothetical protein